MDESKLRTSERLVNLIALHCIPGWRIFWTTMMHRAAPTAPAETALTTQAIKLLDRLVQSPSESNIISELSIYLYKLACLGGYLGRSRDPPAGNMVIWRGLSRLTEIELGFELASELWVIERMTGCLRKSGVYRIPVRIHNFFHHVN